MMSRALFLSLLYSCGTENPIGTSDPRTPPGQQTTPTEQLPPGQTPAADTVAYSGSFGSGSATYTINSRSVLVHVPSAHSPAPPLVIALHGTGAQDDVLSAMQELDALSVSEQNGFILAAPASSNNGGPNADHDEDADRPGWIFSETSPDLALVRAVIQEARRAYNIDASRVYVVGHSNGAFFAYFVSMKLADRVAAFAENSGGLISCGTRTSCTHTASGATSCSAVMASAPAACKCAIDASSFPTMKPSGRVPPGFLKHNADDTTVSPVYTCRLAEHLGASAQVTIDGAGEHGPTNEFMAKAWTFLSSKTL